MGITIYGASDTPISDLIIDGNEIYNQTTTSEALTLNGNVMGFQVTNNFVHDVNNIGIDFIGGRGLDGAVTQRMSPGRACARATTSCAAGPTTRADTPPAFTSMAAGTSSWRTISSWNATSALRSAENKGTVTIGRHRAEQPHLPQRQGRPRLRRLRQERQPGERLRLHRQHLLPQRPAQEGSKRRAVDSGCIRKTKWQSGTPSGRVRKARSSRSMPQPETM